jgi:hypothetical protein
MSEEGEEGVQTDETKENVYSKLYNRLLQYINNPILCAVTILAHGGCETYDELLTQLEPDEILFNVLWFSPVEQCLSNCSVISSSQYTSDNSRWGKTRIFLEMIKNVLPLYNILQKYNDRIGPMQNFIVKNLADNQPVLNNEEYKQFAKEWQGSFKVRTPVNQALTFDCLSSVSYFESMIPRQSRCKYDFSGIILPLFLDGKTGHDVRSITMNPSFEMSQNRPFVDFSLFEDILQIQNMTQDYFNIIIKFLQIKSRHGNPILISKCVTFDESCEPKCEVAIKTPIQHIVTEESASIDWRNHKIVKIDLETIMMLFVLFLLLSNAENDKLNEINRLLDEIVEIKKLKDLCKQIHDYSIELNYSIDILSHACRPGRDQTLKRQRTHDAGEIIETERKKDELTAILNESLKYIGQRVHERHNPTIEDIQTIAQRVHERHNPIEKIINPKKRQYRGGNSKKKNKSKRKRRTKKKNKKRTKRNRYFNIISSP